MIFECSVLVMFRSLSIYSIAHDKSFILNDCFLHVDVWKNGKNDFDLIKVRINTKQEDIVMLNN